MGLTLTFRPNDEADFSERGILETTVSIKKTH